MDPTPVSARRRTMDDDRQRDARSEPGADLRAAERLGVNDGSEDEGEEVRPSEDETGAGGPPGDPPARTPGQA
jgi:hypothetical protein